MSTIQELIKQNAITTETATFLRACLYAQLNIVIWSPSEDEANILANAIREIAPPEQDSLIDTFISPSPHGVKARIKAQVLVHFKENRVHAIIDISTDIEIPIFELDRSSSDTAELKATGLRPKFYNAIEDAGINLPPSVFGLSASRDKPEEKAATESPHPEPEEVSDFDDDTSDHGFGQGGGWIDPDGAWVQSRGSTSKPPLEPEPTVEEAEEDEFWRQDLDNGISLGGSSPEPAHEEKRQAPQSPPAPPQPAPAPSRRITAVNPPGSQLPPLSPDEILGGDIDEAEDKTKKEDIPDTTSNDMDSEKAQAVGGVDENITRSGSATIDLMGMINSLDEDKRQQFLTQMAAILTAEQTPETVQALYDEILGGNRIKEAQFTAYYARQSAAKTEYGFYVYAHLPDALISADIQQFSADLGGRIPKPAIASQTANLEQGAMLTVMIHCQALEFNQIGIMKKWEAPFVRFDFRYTAPESLVDEFVQGRVAIMLGMIEIANIDFQILITAAQSINLINTVPDDPMQQALFEPSNPANMYQKVFISYSRKDSFVAEEFRKAQIMMGNIVFMDTHTIRAGEAWEEALKRFIREADVFQLFWSEHSAISEHCKFEWEYALNHRCSDTRCIGYIRPAYWAKPLPSPPSELSHLHFAYVPQEGIVS